ncbi:MAG: protein kinase domain-containing protein [Thermoguttaceae bacterium]
MTQACSAIELQLALECRLPHDREQALCRHLDSCEACRTAMGEMAGLKPWCEEAAHFLISDELDQDVPGYPRAGGEESSDVDFTVEHLEPSAEPNVLGRLGGYDVLEVIGRGGMGLVLKGFDRELNRYIAIKVLAPQFARSSLARKRFTREAQAAAAVVHPHVMAIHRVQPSGQLPFLVMPLVAGESLAERLAAHGRLELKETLRIGMQAAAGLAAAHEQGLVHRDVKPANILLEQGVERAVLTDFGLARAGDDASMTRWGVIAGTPQYMSPEQARDEPLDGRSDLFSLGCVLYEMATGTSPFRAETTLATLRRLIDEQPPAMASLNAELPPWFVKIVERLLEKDPARRFASAKEASELLEECLAHVQQPNHVPLPPELAGDGGPPVSKPIRARIRGVSIMLSLLAIGLLAAVIVQTSPPDISGHWSNDDWGQVGLAQDAAGEYSGTFSQTEGSKPGKIRLKWSRIDRRYNGTWSEGEERFGTISLHLVDDRILGAATTDPKSRVNISPLAEFIWTRAAAGSDERLKLSGAVAAAVDVLAPFVDDDTIGAAHVDLSRVSARRAFDLLASVVPNIPEPQRDAQAEEVRKIDDMAKKLVEQGAKDLYFTFALSDEGAAQGLVILPIPAGRNDRAVRAVLPPPFQHAHRVGNVLVRRLPLSDATPIEVNTAPRREEFTPAIESAHASAAWAVFAPSTHTRRFIEKKLRQLPESIGGGPVTIVTRDISWASLGVNAPPEAALHVVVKIRDVEAAKELGRRWSDAVRAAGSAMGLRPGTPQFDSQASLFTPVIDGDRLLLTLDKDSPGIFATTANFAGALRRKSDAARSMNNLKQLALAMHVYHSTFLSFPAAGSSDSHHKPLLSWRVHLLPYIEQDALYRQFHLNEPWDSPHNRPLIEKMPDLFRSPGSRTGAGKTNYAVPVGNGALWSNVTDKPKLEQVTDGASNTIMIVEVDDAHAVTWTKPDDLEFDPKAPKRNIGSLQGDGFHVVLADGSTRLIGANIDDALLAALFTRAGGEPIDGSKLDSDPVRQGGEGH